MRAEANGEPVLARRCMRVEIVEMDSSIGTGLKAGIPASSATPSPAGRAGSSARSSAASARDVRLDARLVPRGRHEIGERVRRAQHGFQNFAGRQPAGAQMIERGLENMGERHEIVEAESAGAALDRVHRAKHGVDRFGIAIAVVDRKKTRLQARQAARRIPGRTSA